VNGYHGLLPSDIFWQLGVYWAQTVGVDPAEVLSELMTRIGSIHWKDGPAVHGELTTALGRGTVEVPRIVRPLTRPADWVIELDECATNPPGCRTRKSSVLSPRRTL
jgi:sugar phosphate isomerase/epimerase